MYGVVYLETKKIPCGIYQTRAQQIYYTLTYSVYITHYTSQNRRRGHVERHNTDQIHYSEMCVSIVYTNIGVWCTFAVFAGAANPIAWSTSNDGLFFRFVCARVCVVVL